MLTIIISIISILITIFLIVGIHELGHFVVARAVGIKVLRFSIGFGKSLFSFRDKSGTEYVFAAIPLGGYVKMLDETEGNVPENEVHLAYNRQPIYKKVPVVLAGPLSNFIFAFVLYWLLFVIGFTSMTPIIGKIIPDSIAAKAQLKPGEQIVRIENQSTITWINIVIQLMSYLGEDRRITMETKNIHSNTLQKYSLDLAHWKIDELKPEPLQSLGIIPYEPTVRATIHQILPHTPAASSPLKIGDTILFINNHPVKDWFSGVEIIGKNPDKILSFTIQRGHEKITFPIHVGYKRDILFEKHGFLGLAPKVELPPYLFQKVQFGPLAALSYAKQNTWDFIRLNFVLMGKIVTGKVSLQSLGGPITIAESAGSALNTGIIPFINFLAFLSIAIGVVNILPIPGLDGGHLLFYFIEAVIRRPLSQRTQLLLYRLGFIFLILLLIQAMTNDVMRLGG